MRAAFLIGAVLVAGCDDGRRSQLDEEGRVAEVAALIASLPDWPATYAAWPDSMPFGVAEQEAFEAVARALVAYDIDEIRAALEVEIAREEADPGFSSIVGVARSNGFVLLRLVFDLPERFPTAAVEVANPYVGGAFAPGERVPEVWSLNWPVVFGVGDEVVEIAPFAGINGRLHQLIDELDWFAESFDRRVWVE